MFKVEHAVATGCEMCSGDDRYSNGRSIFGDCHLNLGKCSLQHLPLNSSQFWGEVLQRTLPGFVKFSLLANWMWIQTLVLKFSMWIQTLPPEKEHDWAAPNTADAPISSFLNHEQSLFRLWDSCLPSSSLNSWFESKIADAIFVNRRLCHWWRHLPVETLRTIPLSGEADYLRQASAFCFVSPCMSGWITAETLSMPRTTFNVHWISWLFQSPTVATNICRSLPVKKLESLK